MFYVTMILMIELSTDIVYDSKRLVYQIVLGLVIN